MTINKLSVLSLLAVVIIVTQPMISKSQTFEWIRSQTVDYSYSPDALNYVVSADEAGNVVFAGMDIFNQSYGGMYGDLFLKKYSPAGDELFANQITGPSYVLHLEAKAGKYYLTGAFKESLYFPEGSMWLYSVGNDREYFLAVFDENGVVEDVMNLSQQFPGADNFKSFHIDDENMLWFGFTTASSSKIEKIDLDGNVHLTIEQSNVVLINSIDSDPDGNIVVSGAFAGTECYFGGQLYEVDTDDNMYIVKYNQLGEVQWVNFIENVLYSTVNQVRCDNSGNIYFGGELFSNISFGTFQSNGPDWVYDFFLTKLNAAGEFQWLVEVPEDENLGDASVGKLNFLDVDTDDNVYVSGFLRGTIDWGNNVVSTGNIYYDLLLLKFSNDGIIQWSKSGGSSSLVKSLDLCTDTYGNCYMASVGGGEMTFDSITYYEEGFVYPFLIKLNNNLFTGINPQTESAGFFEVYPNPATTMVNINFLGEINQPFQVSLYSPDGRKSETYSSIAATQNTQIQLPPAKGIYVVEVRLEDGRVFREKVLVN